MQRSHSRNISRGDRQHLSRNLEAEFNEVDILPKTKDVAIMATATYIAANTPNDNENMAKLQALAQIHHGQRHTSHNCYMAKYPKISSIVDSSSTDANPSQLSMVSYTREARHASSRGTSGKTESLSFEISMKEPAVITPVAEPSSPRPFDQDSTACPPSMMRRRSSNSATRASISQPGCTRPLQN
jgi:hypothetical protein